VISAFVLVTRVSFIAMPTYTATGLIVHRINLGETDRIVTLFTREQGKLSAVAKGARRPKTRFGGMTELFMVSRFLLATGKSLDIVTQCEITQSFSALRMDLNLLARATYFCELLDRLTPERDEVTAPELFDLTVAALELLQRAPDAPDVAVHAYELHLLTAIGYEPELHSCVRCGLPIERFPVGFSPSLGGVLCPADRSRADDAVLLHQEALSLLQTLAEADTETILSLRPDRRAAAEVAKALRWYIRFRTERDLKSADFLDQIRAAGS
jgi:DNA repair protein RecO (recombination protein O)